MISNLRIVPYEPVVRIAPKQDTRLSKLSDLVIVAWSRDRDSAEYFTKNWKYLRALVDNEGRTLAFIQLYGRGENMTETAKMFCFNRSDYVDNVFRHIFSGGDRDVRFECGSNGKFGGNLSGHYNNKEVFYFLREASRTFQSKVKLKTLPTIWIDHRMYDLSNMTEGEAYLREKTK